MKTTALLLCLRLPACASVVPNAANKYDPADLEAAIAIAQAHGDSGPLACYQALKSALALQAVGPLSLYEAQRVSLPAIRLACIPIALP